MTLEGALRDLVAELVRDEVRRALAAASAPDEFLSTRAAAKLSDVAPGTIRRWIREGRLKPHKAGRVVRVRRAEIEKLLRDGGERPAADLSPEDLARRAFGG